jgi:Spy/CpxP family protein refolding chaperone
LNDAAPGSRRAGATLLLVGTFALGMISGAALLHIARLSLRGPGGPPPGPAGEPPLEHMRRTLSLTPDQSERLRAVLDDGRGRIKAAADETREQIRAVLTPEQREKFDAMRPPHPPRGGFGPGPPPFPPPDGPPPEGGPPEGGPPEGGPPPPR